MGRKLGGKANVFMWEESIEGISYIGKFHVDFIVVSIPSRMQIFQFVLDFSITMEKAGHCQVKQGCKGIKIKSTCNWEIEMAIVDRPHYFPLHVHLSISFLLTLFIPLIPPIPPT